MLKKSKSQLKMLLKSLDEGGGGKKKDSVAGPGRCCPDLGDAWDVGWEMQPANPFGSTWKVKTSRSCNTPWDSREQGTRTGEPCPG